MHLGQSPKGILIGIAQLPLHSRRGNHFEEIFRDIVSVTSASKIPR